MYFQLQSWPTPEIFINRRSESLEDLGEAQLMMVSVVVVQAMPQSVVEDTAPGSSVALQSLINVAAMTQTQTEAGDGAIALQSLINVVAMTQTQTEAGDGAIALQSLVNITPQTRTTSESSEGDGNVALQSMVIA